MAESAADPTQEQRLQASRAQYLGSLSARLRALHDALNTVSAGGVGETHAALLRRTRAMSDAASVLGYEEMGHAFRAAFELLALDGDGSVSARAIHEARSLFDLVPSLIPDAPNEDTTTSATQEELKECAPLTLLCMISAGQQVLLRRVLRGIDGMRIVASGALPELQTQVTTYEPDWVIVDGRRADALEAVARLRARPCLVLDAPEHVAGRLKAAGARFVAREGAPLATSVLEAFRSARVAEPKPKSDAATISRAIESASQELRDSLLVGLSPHETQQFLTPAVQSSLEALTWSAISRMREVISEASGGAIQYPERAPEGAMLVTGKSALRHTRHPAADTTNLRGRRVLVADDDSSVIWFLSSILRAAGAEVSEARDGLEALRVARRILPDLVISDVLMPELDGFALCRNLKRDVLLSDVPVILLSWKEDLLQRVHELGAGAAGYIPKEAEATVIVERCCEALEPRVRIERRLRDKDTVHGRLDGVTPRLVLELAASSLESALVSFSDAAFNYQVWTSDGRVVAAARRGRDGVEQRGESVLPGLLGMRAGRFSVEPTREGVKAELFGSLNKLLAPAVDRARRAVAQLQGAHIYDVVRLDIDYAAIAPYSASSPSITTKLIERLVQGLPPASLLHQVSAGLLESVLTDLAQRGAVLSAWDIDGKDLLTSEEEPAEAFDVDLGPPRPGTILEAAKGAPKVTAQSTSRDVERAAEFAERAAANVATRGPAPNVDAQVASVSAEPAPSLASQISEEDIITPPFLRALPADPFQAAEHAQPVESADRDSVAAAFESGEDKEFDQDVEGVLSKLDGVEPVIEAAREFEPGLIARRQKARPTLTGLGFPSPPRHLEWDAPGNAVSVSGDALEMLFSDSSPAPNVAEILSNAAPQLNTASARRSAAPAPVSAKEELRTSEAPAADDSSAQSDAPVALTVPASPPALELAAALLGDNDEPVAAPVSRQSSRAPAVADRELSAAPIADAKKPEAPNSVTGAKTATAGDVLQLTTPPAAPQKKRSLGSLARALLPAAVVLGTAGAVFGLSNGLWHLLGFEDRSGAASGETKSDSVVQQAAALSPVASAANVEPPNDDEELSGANGPRRALAELRSTLTDVPSDVQVAADNGLVEINTEGRHKIYVNDVFFGRGPIRRVPLKAGTYSLVLRLDGAEQTFPFEVVAGRRTRVEPVAKDSDNAAAVESAAR